MLAMRKAVGAPRKKPAKAPTNADTDGTHVYLRTQDFVSMTRHAMTPAKQYAAEHPSTVNSVIWLQMLDTVSNCSCEKRRN